MRIPNLAGAITIAFLTAASLHVSVKPADANDARSVCAMLAAIEMNILNSGAPDFAKEIAINAIYSTKRAVGCERLSEAE